MGSSEADGGGDDSCGCAGQPAQFARAQASSLGAGPGPQQSIDIQIQYTSTHAHETTETVPCLPQGNAPHLNCIAVTRRRPRGRGQNSMYFGGEVGVRGMHTEHPSACYSLSPRQARAASTWNLESAEGTSAEAVGFGAAARVKKEKVPRRCKGPSRTMYGELTLGVSKSYKNIYSGSRSLLAPTIYFLPCRRSTFRFIHISFHTAPPQSAPPEIATRGINKWMRWRRTFLSLFVGKKQLISSTSRMESIGRDDIDTTS